MAAIVFVLMGLDMLPSAMSAEPSEKSTFVSPDKVFQFDYPSSLILCQPDSRQENLWRPTESCGGYIPVCDASAPGTVVSCVAYPTAEYAGSTFEGAALVVVVLKEKTTENACLSGLRAETINGVRFKKGENGWVGMGNVQDNSFYRTFHDGTCYELDINISQQDDTGYDPGKVPKGFGVKQAIIVQMRLEQALRSFKFMK